MSHGKLNGKLIAVLHIPEAAGSEISSAVTDCFEKWELHDNVQALYFNITAANTGIINGQPFSQNQR